MEYRFQTTIEQQRKALNEFAFRQEATPTPKKKGLGWSLFGLNTVGTESAVTPLYKVPSDQSAGLRLGSSLSKSHETLGSSTLPRSLASTPAGIVIGHCH